MNINPKIERNRLLVSLLMIGLLGIYTGYMAEFLAVFLIVFIVFYYRQFQQLYQWAQSQDIDNMPFEDGLLGQFAGYIAHCKKQRQAQKESVKYQLERFKKLISVFPDGVVILSLSNEIQWFNQQASKLLVLEKRDVNQPINHLVRNPIFMRFIQQLPDDAVLVMDAPAAETNFSAEKIEIRLLPYGDDERLLLVRDVTKVERANQMRKDFVSNASHELRTPLTVMKGYVEMLLASTSDDEGLSAPLRKVDQQVLKMQTMIEELLALSRLEEGKLERSDSVINLRSLCEQIKSELAEAAAENEQNLIFNIEPTFNIKGNKTSLLTVLRNLVANAINYSSRGGDIYINWSENERGDGILAVKDSGKGIAARHLARLTERFYRVPETNVLHKAGTGLGLAIVKHELERHEAQLVIESKVGEGSQFQCVFPLTRLAPQRCH